MNVTRLEPYSIFGLLNRNLDPFPHRRLTTPDHRENAIVDWVPAVDISEEKERFVLRADLPGVVPDVIDISMDKGVLTVSGERSLESNSETDGFRRVERISGKFERRFSLPDSADADNISARSSNGTLEVTIPKLPEIQQRRITVEAA